MNSQSTGFGESVLRGKADSYVQNRLVEEVQDVPPLGCDDLSGFRQKERMTSRSDRTARAPGRMGLGLAGWRPEADRPRSRQTTHDRKHL